MSNSDNRAKCPWILVVVHFLFASAVIVVISFTDSKDSDTERKLRQTLELQEQRMTQLSDKIAKLRHQLLVHTAQRDTPPEPGSDGGD